MNPMRATERMPYTVLNLLRTALCGPTGIYVFLVTANICAHPHQLLVCQ